MLSNPKSDVLKLVPEGMLVTRQALLKEGLKRHTLDNLVKSGQLHSPARGVYTRPGTKLTWQGVVCSLQRELRGLHVVGGLTALELHGAAHYLAVGKGRTVHLYGDPLPPWLKGLLPQTDFVRHSIKELQGRFLVSHEYSSRENYVYNRDPLTGFTQTLTWREDVWPLTVSTPERALLEVLNGVPEFVSFEHADQLMQGLTNLSPRRLQELLEQCRNIKVRRLFFWLADRHQYAWLKKIDRNRVSLGSGKRVLAKGGKLDRTYLITVPEDMYGQK